MTLYSAWYCPFARRAWMTLLHKGIAFDYVEVDPFRASSWWLVIPFAYRIDVLLGHYRDFALPNTGAVWSRYHGWYRAMCETEIFRSTSTDHPDYRERLIAFYLPYSQGKAQQDVKQEF